MLDINELIEHEDLFLTEFPDGTQFYWHLLPLREYYLFTTLLSQREYPFDIYLQIFKRVVHLDSDLLNRNLPLGYFVSIGKAIMHLSGDSLQETFHQEIQSVKAMYPANSLDEILKNRIYVAFPSFTPKDLNSYSRSKLIRLFVQAENLLVMKEPNYKPLDLSQITFGSPAESNEELMSIDFDLEAGAQKRANGPWAEESPLPSKRPGLSKSMAKKLDQRKRVDN